MLRPERPSRELHHVYRERRNAERVVDKQLVIALLDAHRREDRAGRIGSHQQIDLVGRDELLVERTRKIGLRLVVPDDPFDLTTKQTAALVELLDVDLADDLVDEARRGERPGP